MSLVIKPGMLAYSKAGHDKDTLYVILKVEEDNVFLSDGRLKPINKPKRKNVKHIQPAYNRDIEFIEKLNENLITDSDIKATIKQFLKKEQN